MKEKTAYKVAAISGMIALNLVVFGYVLWFFSGLEPGDTKMLLAPLPTFGVLALSLWVSEGIFDPDKDEEEK